MKRQLKLMVGVVGAAVALVATVFSAFASGSGAAPALAGA